jgi:putative transposase
MPRSRRAAAGGLVYHVLNRGNGRMRIFRTPGDYLAFLQLLGDGKERADIELFGFCLMPNHWHLVLRPRRNTDLTAYLSWVTNTHVKRYRAHYPSTSGHLYQGRFKSFPVEANSYFLNLLRYVESNALRTRLVARAEACHWSSLGCDEKWRKLLLDPWPVARPRRWTELVNERLEKQPLERITASLRRGRPLGEDAWTTKIAARLGLQSTLNERGRPKLKEGG